MNEMILALFLFLLFNGAGLVGAEFAYPDYCTRMPFNEALRQSPLLSKEDQERGLELNQVHLIFRHGARTPAAMTPCWKGYNPQWNCDYDEASMGIPLSLDSSETTLTFQKVFDANPANNIFGGTCQKGQLLMEGVLQHRTIGRFLAESYFLPNEKKIPTPDSPSLIKNVSSLRDSIHLRSTDMPRTRLSAQNLLTSLLLSAFGEKFPEVQQNVPILHTMDIEQDYMAINPKDCPRLFDVSTEAFKSEEFQEIVRRHAPLLRRIEDATKQRLESGLWPDRVIDCLMSHICSDRWDELPTHLNPNGTHSTSARQLISAITTAVDEEVSSLYLYKNSSYSRLGISRFMQDIRHHISSGIKEDHTPSLFLWSGHDTTVMPFLASFGPNVWDAKWPPYASLVVIEIFKDTKKSFWFRFIANGKIVTRGIPGCKDLCEVDSFFDATSWADQAADECLSSRRSNFLPSIGVRSVWPDDTSSSRPPPHSSSFTSAILWVATGASLGILTASFAVRAKSSRTPLDLSRPLLT